MKHFRSLTGEEEEDSVMKEFNDACTLTYQQRMIGFGVCFVVGWLITFLAVLSLPQIGSEPQRFAILYTLGNIVALCSTMFLFGPCKQLKNMFHKKRIIATIIYLVAMALTLFCAFQIQKPLPVILCMLFQFAAMVWYCLSYIPYGREMLANMCKGCCV